MMIAHAVYTHTEGGNSYKRVLTKRGGKQMDKDGLRGHQRVKRGQNDGHTGLERTKWWSKGGHMGLERTKWWSKVSREVKKVIKRVY